MGVELYVQQAVLETDHVLFFMKPRPKGSFTYDIKLRARFFSPCMKSNQKQLDFLKKFCLSLTNKVMKNQPWSRGWMQKAPPANPRDYISWTFKISPREGR